MFKSWVHPSISRRTAVQVGATGILGLGMNHLGHLRSVAAARSQNNKAFGKAKSCIYIFLSGGLAQQDSFDLKPAAPAEVRGEFNPIARMSEWIPGITTSKYFLSERKQITLLVSRQLAAL